jgi:hypothetical protein
MPAKANNNLLFTVIMEFDGTTSASQIKASHAEEALQIWASRLLKNGRHGLSQRAASELQNVLETDRVEEIRGLFNVWCTTALAEERLAILHIVNTSPKHLSGIPKK